MPKQLPSGALDTMMPSNKSASRHARCSGDRLARVVGARLEAEAVIAGCKDVVVLSEAVEERRRHLGVAEEAGPLTEAPVGFMTTLVRS